MFSRNFIISCGFLGGGKDSDCRKREENLNTALHRYWQVCYSPAQVLTGVLLTCTCSHAAFLADVVVAVSLAASVDEWFTAPCLTVVVPALEGCSAGTHLRLRLTLWLDTTQTLTLYLIYVIFIFALSIQTVYWIIPFSFDFLGWCFISLKTADRHS